MEHSEGFQLSLIATTRGRSDSFCTAKGSDSCRMWENPIDEQGEAALIRILCSHGSFFEGDEECVVGASRHYELSKMPRHACVVFESE
jgi:hypothetical protein